MLAPIPMIYIVFAHCAVASLLLEEDVGFMQETKVVEYPGRSQR